MSLLTKIGEYLAPVLPIAANAIAGPLPALALEAISKALGVDNSEEAVEMALRDPQKVLELKAKGIESDTNIILAQTAAITRRQEIVNKTIQTEANSFDAFVRRWRPFYGYCLAITWTIQMILSTIYIGQALNDPEIDFAAKMGGLVSVYSIMGGMWTVALTVLGVAVHKRSQDKQTAKLPFQN